MGSGALGQCPKALCPRILGLPPPPLSTKGLWGLSKWVGDLKITSTSAERQKRSQSLAPVLVIISGNSLVFSRKIITSTNFYRYCAPAASAPVVVKNQSPTIWGLKVLVHNRPRLPTIVVILRRKFPLERGPKRRQKCTIVDDCAHIAESRLKPPHLRAPI